MRKLGHRVLRAQARITWGWVSPWAQVFPDVILTPLHIVPVKILGDCPPSQRVSTLDGGAGREGEPKF